MAPSTVRGAISIPVDAPMTPVSPSAMVEESKTKKRKRVSRACDQCFAKKDRCDGSTPICTFCQSLNRTCTYLRPERKRGPTQGLRPRLEQRIVALETVLGFLLQDASHQPRDDQRAQTLVTARPTQKHHWRSAWLTSSLKHKLSDEPWNFDQDLAGTAAESSLATTSTTVQSVRTAESDDNLAQEGKDESDESDYSEVDLSLHNQSLLPMPMAMQHHEGHSRREFDDQQDSRPASPHPTPDNGRLNMPLLSSGKGGSSLNRGLVPKGTDPNAALGGFEIQFGGNEHDEDWVRGFVIPNPNSTSTTTNPTRSSRRK